MSNYENYELDCSTCPFQKEGCDGMTYGPDGPIYPPCSELDENETIEEKYESYMIQKAANEEYYQRLHKIELEKKKKSELTKKRRLFIKRTCYKELNTVNSLKKRIKKLQNMVNKVDSYTLAINMANKMFGYKQRLEKNEKLVKTLNELNAELEEASAKLKAKQKEIRKSVEYKNIK